MSQSKVIHTRLEERAARRRVVGVIYIVAMLGYLGWRLTVMNPDAPILSAAYFAAELLGFLLGLIMVTGSWRTTHRSPPPAPEGLKVDVFVPVYNEPAEIIRRTVEAARDIRYPHRTFMLDDGDRPELKAIAEELGVIYTAREGNRGAKAGNLNHGLSLSDADFIAVFDSDHIAQPHALDSMLGFFNEEDVAMVQAPQDYYNTNGFQYQNAASGSLNHDQTFFYNIQLSARDTGNAASGVGTSVVYRRTAIDRIGGFPEETVTEDIHTSLKIHKIGLRSIYINEPVAYGVCAADLGEYYKIRHRWAHGNIDCLRIENVLTCGGLTPWQRWSYMSLGLLYVEGWAQLLLFVLPIVTLLSGVAPIDITLFNILMTLLFPIASALLMEELGCGVSRYWANALYSMARFPIHIISFAALFGKKIRWRTSSKATESHVDLRLLAPQLCVLAASVGAVTFGVFHAWSGPSDGPLATMVVSLITFDFAALSSLDLHARLDAGFTVELVVIAGFWALFNALRAALIVLKARAAGRMNSGAHKFHVSVPVALRQDGRTHWARTAAISEDVLELAGLEDGAFRPGSGFVAAELYLPAGAVSLRLSADIDAAGRFAIDASTPAPARDALFKSLYSVDWHREVAHRTLFFETPLDALERWAGGLARLVGLGGKRAPAPTRRVDAWRPALSEEAGLLLIETERAGAETSMIAFAPLEDGAEVAARLFDDGASARGVRAQVVGQAPLSSLATVGLDGARPRRYRIRIQSVAADQAPALSSTDRPVAEAPSAIPEPVA